MYEGIADNPITINALDIIKQTDECISTHSINTAFYSMVTSI